MDFKPFYVLFQLVYLVVCVVSILKQFIYVIFVFLCVMPQSYDICFDGLQCLFQPVELFIDLAAQ